MIEALAERTVSGNPPPTAFLITLWALTVVILGGAIAAIVGSILLRRGARELPDGQPRAGKRNQAGCLLVVAVPAVLFGLFLLDWAVQVST